MRPDNYPNCKPAGESKFPVHDKRNERTGKIEQRNFSRVGWIVTCFFVNMLYAVYLGGLSVVLPAMGAAFHIDAAQQGKLFPANFAGMIASVLVCGTLSDRWGRKRVLLVGAAMYAAGLFLFGIAPNFGLALLAAPLIGAGSGGMLLVSSALASDLYPERRAVTLNTLQVAFGMGAMAGPLLAHDLLARGADWRFLYLALATAMVGLFLTLIFQRVPRTGNASGALQWAEFRALLHRPAFGLLCLTQLCYAGAEVGFFQWMPTYFHQLPQGVRFEGAIVGVFWGAMTLGRLLMSGLLERLPVLPLGIGLALAGATCAMLTLLTSLPIVVLCFVALTGLLFAGIYSIVLAAAAERFAHRAGTVFGGIAACAGLGSALFPWAIGTVGAGSAGWRVGLSVVPLLMAGVAANFALLRRQD